jgi:radical SAM protein with 4Fe4S-binding SPASM domain
MCSDKATGYEFYKALGSLDRLNMINNGDVPNPLYLNIDPVYGCNVNCSFCFREKGDKKISFLDDKMFLKIVDEVLNSDVRGISFGIEGEPTLHKLLSFVIKKMNKAGKYLGLFTNGILLHGELAEAVSMSNGFCRVSLNAYDGKSYKDIFGTKDGEIKFRTVLKNMANLINLRNRNENGSLVVGVNYVIENGVNDSLKGIELLCDEIKGFGADFIQVKSAYIDQSDELDDEDDLMISNMVRYLAEKFEDENFSIIQNAWSLEDSKNDPKGYDKCYMAYTGLAIDPNGSVYHCCQNMIEDENKIMDLKDKDDFSKFWLDSKRLDKLKKLDPKKCSECRWDEINKALNFIYRKDKLREVVGKMYALKKEHGDLDAYYRELVKDSKFYKEIDLFVIYKFFRDFDSNSGCNYIF